MFPRNFKNDAKMKICNHNAIQFTTTLSKQKVVAAIKSKGIAAFVTPDKVNTFGAVYEDKRISTTPTYQRNAGCCSFTKDPSFWYLYPIHKAELANVGLTEQDIINWLKYLNDLRVGFKYLYFGEQEGGNKANETWRIGTSSNTERYPNNTYYWIGVQSFPTSTSKNIPYLHWIYLRYLINGTTSSNVSSGTYHHAYYNIPRVIMYMVEKLGMKPFKAFMYSLAVGAWYCGYGLAYSDYDISNTVPDLDITAAQFKIIWQNCSGYVNHMLTTQQSVPIGVNKKAFEPKHDPTFCWNLYNKGQIKEIVKYLDKCYYPIKVKAKPKAKANVTKESSAKAKGKIPRIARR